MPLMISLIPHVLRIIKYLSKFEERESAIDGARKEKSGNPILMCTFAWEYALEIFIEYRPSHIFIRDVINMPEFQERLGNLLSKPGKSKCTVLPVERDLKVTYGEVERDNAMVFVKFWPWAETDVIAPGACIMRVNETDNHVRGRRGICLHCGAY